MVVLVIYAFAQLLSIYFSWADKKVIRTARFFFKFSFENSLFAWAAWSSLSQLESFLIKNINLSSKQPFDSCNMIFLLLAHAQNGTKRFYAYVCTSHVYY